MEPAAEEVVVNNNTTNNVTHPINNSNNTLLKGKRTKRLRVQSPIPFCALATTTTHSSTTAEGGAENNSYAIVKCSTNATPTTSSEYSVDNEEEDLANCLILLAQGHVGDSQNTNITNNSNNNSLAVDLHNNKFNSRRFMETGSTSNGKVGYYVYECKTCNRTFPSFQALGGHRASHKKPKALQIERQALTFSSDEEDGHGYNNAYGHGHYKNINMSPLSLQLSTNSHSYSPRHYNHHTTNNNSNHKAKVHECSICGAEFTSGQALGGHMRRHRAPMASSSMNLTLSTMAISKSHGHVHDQPKKTGNLLSLDLDLNLPAPEDDNKLAVNSKQLQDKKQQQQKTPLNVFSSPALVDCHY